MRLLSVAIFAIFAVCVSADRTCDPGRALDSNGNCKKCPAGQFGIGGTSPCKNCPAGSSSNDEGSSSCDCNVGYISPSGSTNGNACEVCPAGQASNRRNTACSPCAADTFASNGVCYNCRTGFTSTAGSTACTPRCSAGYQYKTNGQCEICPAGTYAAAGDTSCTNCPDRYTSSAGSGSCTPEPSGRPQNPARARSLCSGPGMKQCNIWSGRGGSECINVLTTLDSCGGCVGPEGDNSSEYTGQDCSTIPHVDKVSCVQGKCRVNSCRAGYEPSGSLCVESAGRIHSRVMKRSHARHDSF